MKLFNIIDKTGRKIHLSKERWRHIRIEHPEINAFSHNDIELANAIATLIVVAVENDELYKRVNKERENL